MVRNMKIIIHGTKGGHHTFTDEKVEMIDARPDSSKVAAIGQQAYSINFNDGDVVFSKYKIVRDVAGEKRTGHIAFSVIIPNEKKLSGVNVKLLLDELAEDYCNKYVENNNLDNVREDWQFVEEINAKFIKEVKNLLYDNENFQQGTEEAAYIYYSSDEELQNYFDYPYDDKYKRFKQIFFVNEIFESKPENPLNALRHNPSSNLTKRIDVQNLKFTLFFDETNIKVQEGDINCRNNSKVHKKSIFKICYSEPHRESREISGTLEDIRSYIDLDQDKRIIKIKNQKLTPIKYTFNFIMTDQNSNPISDAKVVGKYLDQEVELPNPFSVTYEESKEYIVYAKKDDPNLISEETPLKKCFTYGEPPTPIEVKLFLKKRPKEIGIIVQDKESKEYISEFTVRNEKHQEIEVSNNKIKISGYEIDKNIAILVECPGYELSKRQFIPEKEESITVMLEKKAAKKKKGLDKHLIFLPVFGVILVVIIIMCVIHFYDTKKYQDLDKRKEHLDGITINSNYLNRLQEMRVTLCPEQGISDSAFKIITGKSKNSSLLYICSKIDICDYIKRGNIDSLQQIKTYSTKQKEFKEAIESIKDEYKSQISASLNNYYAIRSDTLIYLDSVANFIRYQDSLAAQQQNNNISQKGVTKEAPVTKETPVTATKETPVAKEITKLKNQPTTTPSPFETDFLNLIKKANKKNTDSTFTKLRALCKEYKKNEGCKGVYFVEKIAKNQGTFSDFINNLNKIDEKERQKIKSLSELETSLKELEKKK